MTFFAGIPLIFLPLENTYLAPYRNENISHLFQCSSFERVLGFPITIISAFARVKVTLNRLGLRKNPSLNCTSIDKYSGLLRTVDTMMTVLSCP